MIERYFTRIALPLTADQFQHLPRHPAYKTEYVAGSAWLTPQPRFVQAALSLEGKESAEQVEHPLASIRPLERCDWLSLPDPFTLAFERIPPFSGLGTHERRRAAREILRHTRKEKEGTLLLDACHVAVQERSAGPAVCGAALVVRHPQGTQHPQLLWIFVHPWLGRHGIGTALLTALTGVLARQGEKELHSSILFGNSPSLLWHWRNGFRLQGMTS